MPRGTAWPAGTRERWRREIHPLWAYCMERGIRLSYVARRACAHRGVDPISNLQLTQMHAGRVRVPDWFVEEMCWALEKPVSVIMGAYPGWTEEFGAKYGIQQTEHPAEHSAATEGSECAHKHAHERAHTQVDSPAA